MRSTRSAHFPCSQIPAPQNAPLSSAEQLVLGLVMKPASVRLNRTGTCCTPLTRRHETRCSAACQSACGPARTASTSRSSCRRHSTRRAGRSNRAGASSYEARPLVRCPTDRLEHGPGCRPDFLFVTSWAVSSRLLFRPPPSPKAKPERPGQSPQSGVDRRVSWRSPQRERFAGELLACLVDGVDGGEWVLRGDPKHDEAVPPR
jgi:hypothetical protein